MLAVSLPVPSNVIYYLHFKKHFQWEGQYWFSLMCFLMSENNHYFHPFSSKPVYVRHATACVLHSVARANQHTDICRSVVVGLFGFKEHLGDLKGRERENDNNSRISKTNKLIQA